MREGMVRSVTQLPEIVCSLNVCPSGKTTTRGGAKELELSFANLQQDFLAMIKELFPAPSESPDLVVSWCAVP
jgi:hypothetical protein